MTGPDRDLTGAWALDALGPEERAEFELYLARDDVARIEAIELADTAVELGLSVPAAAPSEELRSRIMDLVAVTPQVPADDAPQLWGDPSALDRPDDRSTTPDAAPGSDGTRTRRSRRLRLIPRSRLALAASVLLLVGLAVGGIGIQNVLGHSTSDQAISRVEQAPDARTARASFTSGSGSAVLTWSNDRARSVISVEHAASTAVNRVYQLWYINGVVARPAGTFTVDGSGNATVALQGTLHRGESVGVTVEPKGGSQYPTTPTVVVIEMA